jgi:RNA polymerase sigma-70 factor, ECF subfamily
MGLPSTTIETPLRNFSGSSMTDSKPEDLDAALMLRFQNGDEAAFDQLVEKFKNPILNYVARQIGDFTEAEDISQHVFIQVYKSAARYEASAKFTTWLFTIARNLCLNEFRRKQRHPTQSLEQTLSTSSETDAPIQFSDSQARSPVEEITEKEIQAKVLEAVHKLPENQRTAILLCRYEGMAYEEIAKVLNTSISATKSLLHRARETLKQELHTFFKET